jgi:hypothetical protein
MIYSAAPRWVVIAAGALGSYLVALSAFLVWGANQGGDEFQDLNRFGAMVAGVFLGFPTVLLFVRRIARAAGATAVAWMAFNAFVWSPLPLPLAGWAAVVALVVLGAMLMDRRRIHTGSAGSEGAPADGRASRGRPPDR